MKKIILTTLSLSLLATVSFAQVKTDSTYVLKPLNFQERNEMLTRINIGANVLNSRTATEDEFKTGVKYLNEVIKFLLDNMKAVPPVVVPAVKQEAVKGDKKP